MTVQTSYSTTHAAAYAGMPADLQSCNTVSKINKGSAVIPYGKGVVTDGETGSKLPTGAETYAAFNGVVMYEINRAQADGADAGAPIDQLFTVVTHGVIWVTVLDTVAKDAPAYVRVGSTGVGDFSGIAGTGVTLGTLLTGAKFLTGGDAGDLVQLSLGLGG